MTTTTTDDDKLSHVQADINKKTLLEDLQAYTAPAQIMSWLKISDPTIYRKGNQKSVR